MKQRVRRTLAFWQDQGTWAVLRLIARKVRDVISGKPLLNSLADAAMPPGVQSAWLQENRLSDGVSALQISDGRFPALRPLKTYVVPSIGRKRFTIVTDSISKGSLFGGVGTAIILAAKLAIRTDAVLRIVTRTEKAPPENVQHILSVYGIELQNEIQFFFSAVEDRLHEIDLHADDTFITTSWWTTAATLPSVPHDKIVYLLQEDERMFYPFGDDRLRCEGILAQRDIRFVINTKLLFDHLVATGLPNIASGGIWFEPAFPASLFHPRSPTGSGKKRFFFYARPNNSRNLFNLGLRVIDQAVSQGVLDPDEWELCLVGKDIPALSFAEHVVPSRHEDMSWSEYADFAGTVDLALSLMYTPHPSYPPLDMAASGAVVVTNRFGNKMDLSGYSENIICSELHVEALVDAIRAGVTLSQSPSRLSNFERNGLQHSWDEALGPTLDLLARP